MWFFPIFDVYAELVMKLIESGMSGPEILLFAAAVPVAMFQIFKSRRARR